MPGSTTLTLPFADGAYRFAFTLPLVNELERAGRSLLDLAWHLQQGVAFTAEGQPTYVSGSPAEVRGIRDVIRLALIGGNHAVVDGAEIEVGPQRAKLLVDTYVYPARPLAESAALAWHILAVQIYGSDHAMFQPDTGALATAQAIGDALQARGEATTHG